MDFLIEYQNHSALFYFMSEKHFHKAIVLSDCNVKAEGDILYIPIYLTMFSEKEEKFAPLPKIDLSKRILPLSFSYPISTFIPLRVVLSFSWKSFNRAVKKKGGFNI